MNQYSIIMDISLDSKPQGQVALLQTSSDNSDNADWFASNNGIGVDESFGGVIANTTWYRVALVVDGAAGTMTSYIDECPFKHSRKLRWTAASHYLETF